MIHRWDLLTFLHWSYEPAAVQRLLPEGLTIETYHDRAWVGLVPFMMEVRLPRGPALPWISHFCETNVRTYVRGPDGTRGVWFLSLDAARLGAVIAGRAAYRLRYFWSTMGLDRAADIYTYTCRRRWPAPRGARSRVKIRVGEPYDDAELSDFDHFLTARWRLYSAHTDGLRSALAEHDPWPLHRAEVLDLDDQLISAAGLAQPDSEPIVHWSPGTEVRIGYPHKLVTP